MYICQIQKELDSYCNQIDIDDAEEKRIEEAAFIYAMKIPFQEALEILNDDGAIVLHAVRNGDYDLARELAENIAYKAALYHFEENPFLVEEFLDEELV